MTPLEQHAAARRAVAVSHLALALLASYRQPDSIGTMMLKSAAIAQHDNAHALLRRARRRLAATALAWSVTVVGCILVWWALIIAAIAVFDGITSL